MFTLVGSPHHTLPVSPQMPTLRDDIGGGAAEFRRRWTRPMRRWELMFPGQQEKLDMISGFMDYMQGDTPFWFDGAGTIEVVEPVLVGIGDGAKTDFAFAHRHIFVASAVIYLNGGATNLWAPIGNGVEMDSMRFSTAPPLNMQITAKYQRRAKVVLDTEGESSRERSFRSIGDQKKSVYRDKYFLQEVPF